jgi:hypothetical protein
MTSQKDQLMQELISYKQMVQEKEEFLGQEVLNTTRQVKLFYIRGLRKILGTGCKYK